MIAACAISAGIHFALAPEHYEEGRAAGWGFAVSAALLAGLAVFLSRRQGWEGPAAAAALFAGLIVAWVLAVTTGVPVFHPEVEPVEGLAVLTKLVELVGLVAALALIRDRERVRAVPLGLTALIAVFSALVALALSSEHQHDHSHAQVRTPPFATRT